HPQFKTHFQFVHRERHIPVVLGPKIHRQDRTDEERELWARDIVVLFKPWRTPADLKDVNETWLDAVKALLPSLSDWNKRVIRNMNVLSECRDAR
ncbi:hypothetical protein C8R43DRAFT_829266, partial [Mycena crocata]